MSCLTLLFRHHLGYYHHILRCIYPPVVFWITVLLPIIPFHSDSIRMVPGKKQNGYKKQIQVYVFIQCGTHQTQTEPLRLPGWRCPDPLLHGRNHFIWIVQYLNLGLPKAVPQLKEALLVLGAFGIAFPRTISLRVFDF